MKEETRKEKEARLMALTEKGETTQEERDWLWEHSMAYHEMGDYATGEIKYDSEAANREAAENEKKIGDAARKRSIENNKKKNK